MKPAQAAQLVYGAGHVVTQRRAHGIEALWIVQLDHRHTFLGIEVKANECAKVCASCPDTTEHQQLRCY